MKSLINDSKQHDISQELLLGDETTNQKMQLSLNIEVHNIMAESYSFEIYVLVINLLLLFVSLAMAVYPQIRYEIKVNQEQICALNCACGIRFHQLIMFSAYRLKNSLPLVCPNHRIKHDLSDSPLFHLMVRLYHEQMYSKDGKFIRDFTIDLNDFLKSHK